MSSGEAFGMRLWRWLKPPSFDDLRRANRAAALDLPRSGATARIRDHWILAHPAAAAERREILGLIGDHFDQRAHDRCLELIDAALEAQNYLVRPGSVEDIWILEGLFDRLLEP